MTFLKFPGKGQVVLVAGHAVSELSGNPETWAAFYLIDPESKQ